MSPSVKAEAPPRRDAGNEEEGEEHKILGEMEELTHAMERKKKREKKIIAKRRTKVWPLISFPRPKQTCLHVWTLI